MIDGTITGLFESGFFSPLDCSFARFIGGIHGSAATEVMLAAALVSKYTAAGHTCLDIPALAGRQVVAPDREDISFTCPPLSIWSEVLRKSPAVCVPDDRAPLVLDSKTRLYLYRYWNYEKKLAQFFRKRMKKEDSIVDAAQLRESLARLFSSDSLAQADWQRVAAITAILKNVCIISGGPGTGKTTTVVKVLALLLEQAKVKLRVALVAPTGKAAARLQGAVMNTKQTIACPPALVDAIPNEAVTIHRLLGTIPYSPYFRHDCKNCLPLDVVVVDEVSMVSLALMAKLVDALPEACRLICLGDKDQLGSVEAGAVLGNLCDPVIMNTFSREYSQSVQAISGDRVDVAAGRPGEAMQDCLVQLHKNFRFGAASGIGRLSQAMQRGADEEALLLLKEEHHHDISWSYLPPPPALERALRAVVVQGYRAYLTADTPEAALALFDRFRILVPVREGPYGVSALNMLVEQILKRESLINPGGRWYAGRPVLILRNDYHVRLFNGDVGLILPDPDAHHELRAFFPAADGRMRSISPARLPEHETVYAMTVHKSQGSEFEEVLFILPDRDLPLLTRELLYTAVTRTKSRLQVWGNESVFRRAVLRRIERTSGLRDALAGC